MLGANSCRSEGKGGGGTQSPDDGVVKEVCLRSSLIFFLLPSRSCAGAFSLSPFPAVGLVGPTETPLPER